MAIDTRNKRASIIGLGMPIPFVLPNPDSVIDSNDRQMLVWLYSGIAAVAAGALTGVLTDNMRTVLTNAGRTGLLADMIKEQLIISTSGSSRATTADLLDLLASQNGHDTFALYTIDREGNDKTFTDALDALLTDNINPFA